MNKNFNRENTFNTSNKLENFKHDKDIILNDLLVWFRFTKSKFYKILKKNKKNFLKNLLYISKDNIPTDFIKHFRMQYPNYEISVIKPILEKDIDTKNILKKFRIFIQNKKQLVTVCKLNNDDNITTYGLYVDAFSNLKNFNNLKKIQYLAPYIKSVRFFAKKLKPNLIQSDQLPFFLGSEFEAKFPASIKILQTIKDFSQYENNKEELFWTTLNIANKKNIKKIYNDKFILTNLTTLFERENKKTKKRKIKNYIKIIYKNYYNFRENLDKNDVELKQNIIFKRLNSRCIELFPKLNQNGDLFYNQINSSIAKANAWAVYSKSYYEEIFSTTSKISEFTSNLINKTAKKSYHIDIGFNTNNQKIIQDFDINNFRENRIKNKKYLLKELNHERINLKFIDSFLFNTKNKYEILGYLNNIEETPLLLCQFSTEIFAEGFDIAINALYTLMQQNKRFNFIINIPEGLYNPYVNSILEYLSSINRLDGHWVFINNKINNAQFYASCDFMLLSDRYNPINTNLLQALKLGCIPISINKGVYNDTITNIFKDLTNGNGFIISENYNEQNIQKIYSNLILKALNFYSENPFAKNILIKNAMNYDSSWTNKVLEKYYYIYEKLTN